MNHSKKSSTDWWGAIGFSLYFVFFSKGLNFILSGFFGAPPSLAYSLSMGVPMLLAFPLFIQKRVKHAPENRRIWSFPIWFMIALIFSITAYFL